MAGRSRQLYAWLGAAAVALGVGAAMAGGPGVAYADSGGSAQPGSGRAATHAPAHSSSPRAGVKAGPAKASAAHARTSAPAPRSVAARSARADTNTEITVQQRLSPFAVASDTAAVKTSQWVPVLKWVAWGLTLFGGNTNQPTPPKNPPGALLWRTYRQISAAVGVHPPQAGTPTVGTPDPISAEVTGTLGFTHPDGLPLTYRVANLPTSGAVHVNSDGTYTWGTTLTARIAVLTGGPSTDTFTITASDGLMSTNETVTVPILPIDGTPTDPYSLRQSTDPATGIVTGTLYSSDPARRPLTFIITSDPINGTAVIIGDAYIYTPTSAARAQAGIGGAIHDSFTVTATNGTFTSTASPISVPITPIAQIQDGKATAA